MIIMIIIMVLKTSKTQFLHNHGSQNLKDPVLITMVHNFFLKNSNNQPEPDGSLIFEINEINGSLKIQITTKDW